MKEFFQSSSDQIALITDHGEKYTFADLSSIQQEIFNSIGKRTLVFCLCQNSIGSLAGYLSFISNKVVPLMIDAKIETSLLDNLLETYQPEYLWLPKTSEYGDRFTLILEMHEYCLIQTGFSTPKLNDQLSLLLATSGSTGSPKLVRLSEKNILANAKSIAQYLAIDSSERAITALPMNYSFGLSIIHSHLISRATLLLTDYAIIQKEFWTFLKEEKATSLSGVPYTFEMLNRLRFTRMELPHLKTLTQAGGKLSQKLNEIFSTFCHENGKKFFVMYGQTEATARMSYLPPNKSLSKIGSIGNAIPGGQFSLLDEEKREVEKGCVGELVYKGDNVSLGYATKLSDLILGDENHGILYTGDLAKQDDEGDFYIVGRKKRFIKIYGNRVNLDQAEQIVKQIVDEAACAGDDDLMKIYLTNADKLEDVHAHITKTLSLNHRAFQIKIIDEIPKNAAGKTIYSALN